MARGPKKKPQALKLLEGNPGRREINPLEPTCEELPAKPSVVAMDQIASEKWDDLLRQMPVGIYAALDTQVLASHCMAWSMLVKAQNDIEANGLTLVIEERLNDGRIITKDARSNPAIRVWRSATDVLLKTADRLGLTPSARAVLKVPKGGHQTLEQGKFGHLIKR